MSTNKNEFVKNALSDLGSHPCAFQKKVDLGGRVAKGSFILELNFG